MAKKKEIKYNLLSKTADSRGALFETYNGVHYVGNSYCVIFGMGDEEFALAVEKSKAIEYESFGKIGMDAANIVKWEGITAEYTHICYNTHEGMVHYFRTSKGKIVRLKDKFFEIVKDLDVVKVYGLDSNRPIVFELKDGKNVVVFPCIMNGKKNEMIEKIIEKICC